jgi:hypothetical protein
VVITYLGGAQRSAVVARECCVGALRVNSGVYALLSSGIGEFVRCVGKLIPVREESACIDLDVGSKYACTIIEISIG